MKKVYLSLAIAGLLVGCASTQETATTDAVSNTAMTVITSNDNTLIADPQLSDFRSNSGKSTVWHKDADKNSGQGDVGSSSDTAFGNEGSARIRFRSEHDDFASTPGLSQEVQGLKPNTDYVLSFYYSDKKGSDSISNLIAGARGSNGKVLGEKSIHVNDLAGHPKGAVKKAFLQASVDFNSGQNTSVLIYTKMKLSDPSKINKNGDIGKQTEVRIDEFALTTK